MKLRPFYRWKGFWLGVLVLVLALLVGVIGFVPGRAAFQRPVRSPGGDFVVFALPFHGAESQGPEGGLIIYLSDRRSTFTDRHQTSLQGTRRTRLEWIAAASPESFRIWDEQGTRMVWRVEGQRAVCVEGMEFLLPAAKGGGE